MVLNMVQGVIVWLEASKSKDRIDSERRKYIYGKTNDFFGKIIGSLEEYMGDRMVFW